MEITPPVLRDALLRVEREGWDGAEGRELLERVRREVVRPVVLGSGLRGPAADQAEASAWQAAWDALRRPSALTAENPGGMVWVAVRRAVWAELRPERVARRVATVTGDAGPSRDAAPISLERLVAVGWQPSALPSSRDIGAVEERIVSRLVDAGWGWEDAADAIAIMADQVTRRPSGAVATRWRWVATRLAVPEWQARRLAVLLLGSQDVAGVVELVARSGFAVLDDGAVLAAFRSTRHHRAAGPAAWLACVGDGVAEGLPVEPACA